MIPEPKPTGPAPEEEAALAAANEMAQAAFEEMVRSTGAVIVGRLKGPPPVAAAPPKPEPAPPPEKGHADLLHGLAGVGLHGEAMRVFRELEPQEAAALLPLLTPEARDALKKAAEEERKQEEPAPRAQS